MATIYNHHQHKNYLVIASKSVGSLRDRAKQSTNYDEIASALSAQHSLAMTARFKA